MKKFLVCFCLIFVPCVVFAATMCAKNNTLIVALDPKVGGSGYTYNANASTWETTFSYGRVKGVSACTSYGGSMGQYLVSGSPITATRGEASGKYCWCKATHPVASRWVFCYDLGSASSCAGNCAYYCGVAVQAYEAMRVGLFGSVSQ